MLASLAGPGSRRGTTSTFPGDPSEVILHERLTPFVARVLGDPQVFEEAFLSLVQVPPVEMQPAKVAEADCQTGLVVPFFLARDRLPEKLLSGVEVVLSRVHHAEGVKDPAGPIMVLTQ